MNQGGIFSGPNALGQTDFNCSGPEFVKEIQRALQARGATNLKVDGIWGACTGSAWNKIMGQPLVNISQVKDLTGRTCTSGYVAPMGLMPGPWNVPAGPCNTGEDQIGGGGTTSTGCPENQVFSPILGICVPDIGAALLPPGSTAPSLPSGPTPSPEIQTTTTAPAVAPAAGGNALAEMFGDNYLLILGAMAVGVGAVVYFGSKKKAPKRMGPTPIGTPNRRRRRRRR